MNLKELAWAAGFFDGEGTTHAIKQRKGRASGAKIMMALPQTNLETLERFQRAVGVGVIYGPHVFKGNKHQRSPMWRWQAHQWQDVQVAIAKLWKYLSRPKKDQFLRYLAVFRSGVWGRQIGRPPGAKDMKPRRVIA